jgi:galactokinase/mevalonate kinase-like predicted kinase
MDMYLIYTGITRSSTNILQTINIDNSVPLLEDVINLEKSINELDIDLFNNTIRNTWINKKNTSPLICSNENLMKLDDYISNDKNVLSHKLLGAGNGGYFLIFTDKDKDDEVYKNYQNVKKIKISEIGIQSNKI